MDRRKDVRNERLFQSTELSVGIFGFFDYFISNIFFFFIHHSIGTSELKLNCIPIFDIYSDRVINNSNLIGDFITFLLLDIGLKTIHDGSVN